MSSIWLSEDQKQILRSCTLVARNWLPASRHALFSDVTLTRPAAWDSFVRWVVNADDGRPWLASIHRLTFKDQWYRYRSGGRQFLPEPISGWRGQYVVPILAGRLPNLEYLSVCVDWATCQPHPSTFGMFAQFASLREVRFVSCQFPSFSAFRRVLVSLPALEDLTCMWVHWPCSPQPSILAIQTSRPVLQRVVISILCHGCMMAVLEWLIHTPTRSALVELDLRPGWQGPPVHQILLPSDRNLDYYGQVFGPSIRRAFLDQSQMNNDITTRMSLSSFDKLTFLSLGVDTANWQGVADTLRPLPARLNTLLLDASPKEPAMDSNRLVTEDGQLKAMKTNGLELLDPVLSRENFKDLTLLTFELMGYRDTLPAHRESTLEAIQQKLPTLHGRTTLDIQLNLLFFDRSPPSSPVVENGDPGRSAV
uniref:Uncharacterized protein n=1 Tax=Ganoderma boninense TaxID=34458 RepID=A0A5K1JWS3_9APHY|nr:Uncharacterized protein [Ganoderma boninense]